MADDLWVIVTAGGQQWSYQGRGTCPNLSQTLNGDGDISWAYDWNDDTDTLPPRFARVEAHDGAGLVQTARLIGRHPPHTSDCNGQCQLNGEGLGSTLGDRKFDASRVYGPRWADESGVIATAADAMVLDAVTQLGGAYIAGTDISANAFPLPDTEDFIGRSAADAINTATALGAGNSTPIVWQVRNGLFRWYPLDLGARYQVLIANGADVDPVDDATRLYNRVIVLYGLKNQAVVYPDAVVYDQIPTAVDLVVNASAEIMTISAAQRLAEGLYGRLTTLELGWSCTITVPLSTIIEQLGVGSIRHWRVPTAQVIRIPDLNPVGRWGAHASSLKDQQLIGTARWDGNGDDPKLVIQGGEIRDSRAMVRQAMYSGGSRVIHAIQFPGLYIPTRDADKTRMYGPGEGPAPVVGEPAAVSFGVGAFHDESNQALITHLPPMPIKIEKGFDNAGTVLAAGLLDTGIVNSNVPPCEIDNWYLTGTPLGTFTVQVNKARKDSGGLYVNPLVAGDLVLSASVTAGKFNYHAFAGVVGDQKPRITEDSIFVYTVASPATTTAFQIVMNGNRIVPGHPGGMDTMPALGAHSE